MRRGNLVARLIRGKGFTLVELLIALVVVGILAGALLLVSAAGADKAQAMRVISDLRNLKAAAVEFNASANSWPSSVTDLSGYLSGPLECVGPVCYEVASGEAGDFVGFEADLSRVSTGVKDRLKGMAGTVSLYSDTALSKAYAGETMAVYPVGYSSSGAMSAKDSALFRANLSSLDQFSLLFGGAWSTSGGALVSPSGGERRVAFGDEGWTDYTLSLEAQLSGKNGYGIFYRADQKPGGLNDKNGGITGYVFQFDPGLGNRFAIREVTNGVESGILTPPGMVSMPSGFDINAQHSITISLEGSRQVIKVDGKTIMDFTDTWRTSGSAGLRVWGSSTATFENIVVTR